MNFIIQLGVMLLIVIALSVSPAFAEEKKKGVLDDFAKGISNAADTASHEIKKAPKAIPKLGKSISDMIDKATGKDKKKK